MDKLLASDALHVTTENEVFTLMACWILQTTTDNTDINDELDFRSVSFFRRLVRLVHFKYLSVDYVANVVTACPLATQSGLLSFILRFSLVARETDPELLAELLVTPAPNSNILPSEMGVPKNPIPSDQSRADPFWTYTSTFNLSDIILLEVETSLYKCVGLVDGYPVRIFVAKEMIEGGTH